MFNNKLECSPFVGGAVIISLAFFLIIPFKFLQLICLGVLFIIGISYAYARILQKSLKVERNISDLKLACKEQIYITFTLKNYSRLPVFTCYYFDEAPYLLVYRDKNSGLVELRPYESKLITYKVSAQNRGLYTVGPVRIRTSDPLGLFTMDFEVHADMTITVRPERIKLITETMPGFPQGHLKITNPVYEDITMRRSIREYENGDEQKRINWRATAKFDKLFTNQYEASYDAPFFIFLNLAEEDYPLQSRVYYTEKAVQMAASIVERSRFLKQRCGFAAYANDFPYLKPKQNQADMILDILALIKTEPGKLNYDPERKFRHQLPAGTLIYVIGPDEVMKYFVKVEGNQQDINTTNTGILRKGV